MPSIVLAKSQQDSLLLQSIFNYKKNYIKDVSGTTHNIYSKFRYNVDQRNFGLWLIPSMHSIARGDRNLLIESFSKLTFEDIDHFTEQRQAVWGTVPRYRQVMSTITQLLIPKLYDDAIYAEHIISPLHRSNRRFYNYSILTINDSVSRVNFRPRFGNHTQLVSGHAYVDRQTGHVIHAFFNGEFDMIRFRSDLIYSRGDTCSLLPSQCKTEAEFKFLGNHVVATFEALYDNNISFADSIVNRKDRQLIDSLRPVPLTSAEQAIYDDYDAKHPPTPPVEKPDTTKNNSTPNLLREFFVDIIGDNLISSIRGKSEKAYFRLSPIINPQYLSYSHRHGFAYKMKLSADYHFNAHRYFELRSQFGYNFKQKRFYFTLPLRFNYNPKRNGYVELVFGNGNRISYSDIANEIEKEHGDSIDIGSKDLDLFDDQHLRLTNNIMLFDWIDLTTGLIYHNRKSVNPAYMKQMGRPTVYNSFAPSFSVTLRPWQPGPVLTLNYERGIEGIFHSGLDYERWEGDAVCKIKLSQLRILNIHIGSGLYSRKRDNYFVDFANFRDNNLPEGWDDDWSGHFQLLDSRLYNESMQYLRHNISYDTPILISPFIPIVGRGIERERLYYSTLYTPDSRPYTEIGYGFTNRYISMAFFTSFMGTSFKRFGIKLTAELFHRW